MEWEEKQTGPRRNFRSASRPPDGRDNERRGHQLSANVSAPCRRYSSHKHGQRKPKRHAPCTPSSFNISSLWWRQDMEGMICAP